MKDCILSHPGTIQPQIHVAYTFLVACSRREQSAECPAPAPEQMKGRDQVVEVKFRSHQTFDMCQSSILLLLLYVTFRLLNLTKYLDLTSTFLISKISGHTG